MANSYKYRADHIGPLVPPPGIEDAGSEAALKLLLSMQKGSGISVASDGEIHGHDIADTFAAHVEDGDPPHPLAQQTAKALRFATMPIKVSLPTPASALVRIEMQRGQPLNREAIAETLLAAIAAEINALIAARVPYVQLNGSVYADLLEGKGDNTLFDAAVALDRRLIDSIEAPVNVRIALRIERNEVASWNLNERSAALLSLPVHRFLVPFRGEPEDFRVLTLAHGNADLVLGLIDAQSFSSPNEEELLSLIDRAAEIVDGDRLALSPRSGFSGKGQPAWDAQRRALEHVANVATRWWGFAM
jgi:methionine synthase II (cobalamin-independent)